MNVLKSYSQGIKDATLRPKMVFVLWLINFLFGSVFYFLLSNLLTSAWSNSIIAKDLAIKFDFTYFFELLVHKGGQVHIVLSAALILIVIYLFISFFLNGGILFSLTQSPGSSNLERINGKFSSIFFHGAGKFFGRFFRLFIYSLILWFVFVLINLLLNPLRKIISSGGANEQAAFYFFWVRVGIGLFLLYLIKMVLDYARIRIVTEDSRQVFLSLWRALGFVFKKLGKTLALYYLLLLTAVVLFGAYFVLKTVIPSSSLIAIVIVFFIQQIFIASRGWMKIAFLGSQLTFYSLE